MNVAFQSIVDGHAKPATTMKTTLDELWMFTAVVDTASITAAAERLEQTVSGVSRALGRLEKKLNTTLMRRTTRRMERTEEGQAFLLHAQAILRAVDDAEEPTQASAGATRRSAARERGDAIHAAHHRSTGARIPARVPADSIGSGHGRAQHRPPGTPGGHCDSHRRVARLQLARTALGQQPDPRAGQSGICARQWQTKDRDRSGRAPFIGIHTARIAQPLAIAVRCGRRMAHPTSVSPRPAAKRCANWRSKVRASSVFPTS